MVKYTGLLVILSIFLLIQQSYESILSNNEGDSFGKLLSNVAETNEKLCNCANYTCKCCLELPKIKACCNLSVKENITNTQRPEYSIEFNSTLNDVVLVKDSFKVLEIPEMCFKTGGTGACAKIVLRREKTNIMACVTIELFFNHVVFTRTDLYCITIPRGNNTRQLKAN